MGAGRRRSMHSDSLSRSAGRSRNDAVKLTMSRYPQNLLYSLLAIVLYGVFAVYLYQPYFGRFTTWNWLLPVNASVAALGCFALSRRWVVGFSGSFLAGVVYGFGPFMLALGGFHSLAGFLAAAIPWLFLPAAHIGNRRRVVVSVLLALLPFAAVAAFFLFFRMVATYRVFVAPIQPELRPTDLVGFLAPLVMVSRTTALPSLYHIPIAPLILGGAMMLKARRYGVLVIIVLGLALTFCRSYLGPGPVAWLGVSPILWLSIPLVCLAVLAGLGLQGLIDAGASDRKWVLATAISLGALAIVTLMLAAEYFQVAFGLADGYARLFVEAAKMYVTGALAVGIVFIIACQRIRLRWLRWAVLVAALGMDIFLSARFIVSQVL